MKKMAYRNAGAIITALSLLFLTAGLTGCNNDKKTATDAPATINPADSATAATPNAANPVALSFREVSQSAGLQYEWKVSGVRPLNIRQTIGNGCAFLDYDGDGNLDILLVGPKTALYKGDGKGHFTDVSAPTGFAALNGDFLGCAVGDYDNDGFDDIFLTAYQGGALLHNLKGQKFENVTKAAGIAAQSWSTSAAFADINGDGYLDLFIGNYVIFGPKVEPQLCNNNGLMTACGPRFYKPEKSRLYVGGPGGRFKDVTETWDAHQVEGKALGVASADFNNTGKISIALANDEMPGDLLENKGAKFDNVGKTSGTAYDENGGVHGGMGVDWGDYNNDGKLDLAVATFQNEAKNIYHNDGDGLFTDKSAMLGMAPATPSLTFGIKWLDFDNDGFLDLMLANGHVQDNIEKIDKTTSYKQPIQLFRNTGGERMEDISAMAIDQAGRRPIVGRGLAVGDYDNDGKVDVLVVDSEGTPLLLHNETPTANHFLSVRLVGGKSNRNGYGARVTVEAGGQKIMRQANASGSYLSSSDSRVHFGLGKATAADTITVNWPGGRTTVVKNIPADKPVTVREDAALK